MQKSLLYILYIPSKEYSILMESQIRLNSISSKRHEIETVQRFLLRHLPLRHILQNHMILHDAKHTLASN